MRSVVYIVQRVNELSQERFTVSVIHQLSLWPLEGNLLILCLWAVCRGHCQLVKIFSYQPPLNIVLLKHFLVLGGDKVKSESSKCTNLLCRPNAIIC